MALQMLGRFPRLAISSLLFSLGLWLALGVPHAQANPPTLADVLEQEEGKAAAPGATGAQAEDKSAASQSSKPPPRPVGPGNRSPLILFHIFG